MAKWGEIKCERCAEMEAKLAQQDDLVQAAVAAALRDAANTCVSCGAPTPNDFCKFCLEEE